MKAVNPAFAGTAEINGKDFYVEGLSISGITARREGRKREGKEPGRDSEASVATLNIGESKDIRMDVVSGFVSLLDVLSYAGMIHDESASAIKSTGRELIKKPNAKNVLALLQRRDRGLGHFDRKENSYVDVYVHPALLLTNTDMGLSKRTWFVSAAAFVNSYHHIRTYCKECPGDFKRIEEHLRALKKRVEVFHDYESRRELMLDTITRIRDPSIDGMSMITSILNLLGLTARCDYSSMLAVKQTLVGTRIQNEDKISFVLTRDHLSFLSGHLDRAGDLWETTSAHSYSTEDQGTGSIIVFPSGHMCVVTGEAETTQQELLKRRLPATSMESIFPYLPLEMVDFSGNLEDIATSISVQRKRKTVNKSDRDEAKTLVTGLIMKYVNHILTSPVLFDLVSKQTPEERRLPKGQKASDSPIAEERKLRTPKRESKATAKKSEQDSGSETREVEAVVDD